MPQPPTLTATQFLAPIPPEEFFRTYWEKRSLVVSRNQPGFYDAVLTLADLDQHFQSDQVPAQYLRMVSKGEEIPASKWAKFEHFENGSALEVMVLEKLLALYAGGATIVVNRINGSLPPMIEFCAALAREWDLHSTQANLYLTPPNAQGFAAHFDRHCVFILQVHGEKTWRLYEHGSHLPVECKPNLFKRVTEAGKLQQELVLRPGDLLYIPRGLVHEACTSDSASLHITLGLFPKYAFNLLAGLGNAAMQVAELRQGVAFGSGCETSRQALGKQMAQWLAGIKIADLPEACRAEIVAKHAQSPQQRFSDMVQAPLITPTSLIARRPEVVYTCARQGDQLLITVRDQSITAPGIAEAALAWMSRKEPFTPSELPVLLLPKRKVSLVSELVKAGLLRIEKL